MYALGCIITGEKAVWPDMSPHTIILKVAGGDFPATDHLPPKIRSIVSLCFVAADKRVAAVGILKEICKSLEISIMLTSARSPPS